VARPCRPAKVPCACLLFCRNGRSGPTVVLAWKRRRTTENSPKSAVVSPGGPRTNGTGRHWSRWPTCGFASPRRPSGSSRVRRTNSYLLHRRLPGSHCLTIQSRRRGATKHAPFAALRPWFAHRWWFVQCRGNARRTSDTPRSAPSVRSVSARIARIRRGGRLLIGAPPRCFLRKRYVLRCHPHQRGGGV
jgi:hypothetical protein